MICKIEDIQNSCKIILSAISASKITTTNDLLEIIVENGVLYLNVANAESYISVKVNEGVSDDFHATINATKFLALISKFTQENVELSCKSNYLVIKSNGNYYKLPLVYIDNKILSLNKIELVNKVNNFEIDGTILNSILKYNSKQLTMGPTEVAPVQKMYYIDGEGAITFTNGACINKFNLPIQAKYLFNDKLVKLFKLFADKNVNVDVAYDALTDNIMQTKIKMECDTITIIYILSCDDSMLNSVPAAVIRGLVDDTYSNTVTVSRAEMLDAISRLSIFSDDLDPSINAVFRFNTDGIVFEYKSNEETITFKSEAKAVDYEAVIALKDLSSVLSSLMNEFVTFKFGNSKCFVISTANIDYVVPETRTN